MGLSAVAFVCAVSVEAARRQHEDTSMATKSGDQAADQTALVFAIVMGALLGDWVLGMVSSWLNYRNLGQPLPREFVGVYDAEAYIKSQSYTRTKTIFSQVHGIVDLAIFLTFWLVFSGFEVVDQLVRSMVPGDGWSQIGRGLLYWGIIMGGELVLGMPWSVYGTFVIEEKFGFNKTTARTFVIDQLKSIALTLVLGPLIGSAVFGFFMFAGPLAWLYCWVFLAGTMMILVLITPVVILPLFYEFTKIEDGDLKDKIEQYATRVGFKFSGIFKVDGSKRSQHSNAFFVGIGATKRIALFDTLLDGATTEQILAIVAHEVGHERLGHVRTGLVISLAHTFVVLYVMSLFLSYPPLFAAFGVTEPSVYLGLLLFQLLYAPVDKLLSILMTMHSRHNEYEADAYSLDTYGDPEAMIDGLKELSRNSLVNLTPHPFHVFLTYSHPPMIARIEAIRAKAASGHIRLPDTKEGM